MATARDPASVGTAEGHAFRQFLAARERGDEAAMRQWWEHLVIEFADRMDGFVAGAHRGRLDAAEHEIAVHKAMIRFATRLVWTFEGTSKGELVNATKRLAQGISIDVQRTSVRRRERERTDLDEPLRTDEGDAEGWHRAEVAEAEERAEREWEQRAAADWVQHALEALGEDDRRVIEMTLEGAEIEEVMEALGVSRDTAYQRRSRALRKLREQGGPRA